MFQRLFQLRCFDWKFPIKNEIVATLSAGLLRFWEFPLATASELFISHGRVRFRIIISFEIG